MEDRANSQIGVYIDLDLGVGRQLYIAGNQQQIDDRSHLYYYIVCIGFRIYCLGVGDKYSTDGFVLDYFSI